MLKRTFVVLFGVVAILALLAATEVVAQTPPPCVGPDCVVFKDFNVWIVRDQNGLFPTLGADGSYIYNYRVDCISRKVNYIDITLPICIQPGPATGNSLQPYTNIQTFYSLDGLTWIQTQYWLFLNGAGDGDFGENINLYHVLKWKIMQLPTFYFSVKITNQQVGAIQAAMLLRTAVGLRPGVTLGPTCPFLAQTLSYAPAAQVVALKLGPGEVCVSKDSATGCISGVFECDDPSTTYPLTPIQSVTVDSSPLQWAGGEGQGQCPTVILVTQGSPLCYTIGSGGNASKVCYCSTNADCQQVHLTSCNTAITPHKCK
jgi:hypothetical protein